MDAKNLAAIGRVLRGFPFLRLAYIYGSALSRDDFRDVDIALGLAARLEAQSSQGCRSPLPKRAARASAGHDCVGVRVKIAAALGRRLGWDFDVNLLGEMPLPLQYRVIATGRCVLRRSDIERTRYEARVLNEFLDFKPSHDRLLAESLRRAARA
ncbi:MAG: hypothetical protein HY922_00490 [Elusimicrobia bacterium]|nr:hypothetical protein [Elusimicrobiota bacterium]